MDRIQHERASETRPTYTPTGPKGYAVGFNQTTGRKGTPNLAAQYNAIQETLMFVIESAGLKGDHNDDTLLEKAIKVLSGGSGSDIGDYKFTAKDMTGSGWLRCDGSTIYKHTHPELVKYLNDGDENAESALLPNAFTADGRGRFLRDIGLSGIPMTTQEDEIRSHRHDGYNGHHANNDYYDSSSAYGSNGSWLKQEHPSDYTGGDETRPVSLLGVLWIKAFNGVINEGNLDAAGLAADVQSNKSDISNLKEIDKEFILWENGDTTGNFPNNSIATLSESLYNYQKICIISGFHDPLNNRQTPTYALTSQLKDGLMLYASYVGDNYYELEIGNNGTTVTSRGHSGSNIRVKRIIGIK